MEQKTFWFEDGTLCAAAKGCRAEPAYQQGYNVTCDYPNATECEKKVHCYWEPSAVVNAVACQPSAAVPKGPKNSP